MKIQPQANQNDPDVDLDALREGDELAWQRFLDAYDPLITSVTCWPKWRFRPHEREDIAQDIRSELMRSLRQFRGDASLKYFVKRVCVNRCIDRIRRQVRERDVFTPLVFDGRDGREHTHVAPTDDAYDPVRQIAASEAAASVGRLLQELNATCATAIRLFYMENLAYKEIAERLDITVNTVGSRLSKCLAKLQALARHDPVLGNTDHG